jgi:hypothetical protein
MDKKDILYGAIALAIILVLALVVKPMVTGQPLNTGLPVPTTQPTLTAVTPSGSVTVTIPPVIPTTVPTTIPTPVETWNAGSISNISFIDPSTYGISFNESLPRGTRIDNVPINTSMTTIATINGKYSGTSQVIKMPFPYWELWYTVDPFEDLGGKEQSLSTSTVTGSKDPSAKGSGSSQTVIQGSYSVIIPTFSLQVMDADDPNRIVRSITPPGGLDKALWTGKSAESEFGGTTEILDPRPWKEKFFEGQRNYYFIINTNSVNSYSVEIRVPTRYIGKY